MAEICEKRHMPRWTAKDVEEIMPDGVPLVPFADVEEILDNLEELQKVVNEYMDAVRGYETGYESQFGDGSWLEYSMDGKLPLTKPFRDVHK